MIDTRRTRLVRVADLNRFRRAVAVLCRDSGLKACATADGARASSILVIVPTRAAARQLQRTLEKENSGAAAMLVTRDELYDELAARLPIEPRRLSRFEREAIVRSAAAEAVAAGVTPPFQLRPGLIAEVVRFYDQLRRQRQSVRRFEEILADSLSADVDIDRGAARMLQQTRFLAAVYGSYERRLSERGFVDEHALRDRLVGCRPLPPLHVVVTVADWIAEPGGLYHADFDLLSRIPGVAGIDVVATAAMLASGFHQRLHEWLPGIEEQDDIDDARATPVARGFSRAAAPLVPVLVRPSSAGDVPVFVRRDREEELIAVARTIKLDRATLDSAVVFNRPLPYLYLAQTVFGSTGIPYQASDALPLAAEPFAAALDLVLEFVASQFTRASLVALLRSPHFQFGPGETPLDRGAIAQLDRALSQARYLGELDRLRTFAQARPAADSIAEPLTAAIAAAEKLQPLLDSAAASSHLRRLLEFFALYVRPAATDREQRAQSAVIGIIEAMAAASADHDDRHAAIDDLATDIRRWIEEETFANRSAGGDGVQLVDPRAARYGDFGDVFVVGLVEGEWPERPRRNVFYPPALLATLGWPSEKDRRGAAEASFVDLLRSARERVSLSTFSLDDEALVEPATIIDEAARARLTVVEVDQLSLVGVEIDTIDPLDESARGWTTLRLSRTPAADASFHGSAGPQAPRVLSVGSIETYLTCPFRFFAQHVLRLEEEPDDDEVMDPKRQGQFVHDVFQRFFAEWQRRGHRAITSATLDTARALFAEIVEERVSTLSQAEAALERTRLLGSPVAPGLADVVFRMEAERPVEVVERLLERRLKGAFEFKGSDKSRTIPLDGVADRIDLLADGTMRLIDYKLSSAPQRSRALQLPVYAISAEQQLDGHRGRRWTVGEAAYIAFRGPKRIAPLFTARSDRDQVLREAQDKLIGAVDAIEAGRFPPTPDDVFVCGFCSFAAVCRKDYVGDV